MAQETSKGSTVEQYTAQQLRRRIAEVAVDIDRLADTIRNRATDLDRINDDGDGNPYSRVVRDIHREIVTAWLNLGVSGLITDAATADVARAKGE